MNLPSRVPTNARKVYSGVVYDIYQWEQELFDGTYTTFEMAKPASSVSVIPIIGEQVVVLREQQPTDIPRISFPGGVIDPGEDPFAAAVRELKEETGMTFQNLKLVAVDDMGSTKLDWYIYRFVATEMIGQVEPKHDPGEIITHELVDFSKAKELASGNKYMSLSVMNNVQSINDLLAMKVINI